VITEHLGDRRKSPGVWSTECIYLLGSTAGVPCAGRAISDPRPWFLICDLRCESESASLNRHKTWPGCGNGLKNEGEEGRRGAGPVGPVCGLDIRNTQYAMRNPQCQQWWAASRRYGGGAEEPAPVPVGFTGHRTQRPRGQVGPPGPGPGTTPSPQPDPAHSSSLNPEPRTQGANGGQYRRLWPL
jgi:hypothetical protein